MDKKVLLLVFGESFRFGPQLTRTRGGEESKKRQKLASQSHIKLIEHIRNKFNLETDIALFSYKYNQEYDVLLKSYYGTSLKYIDLLDTISSTENAFLNYIVKKINTNIDISDYSYIIVVRCDFYLKEMFFNLLKLPSDKVLISHIDPNIKYDNLHGVCHSLFIVPEQYYSCFNYWESHCFGHNIVSLIGLDAIDFLIPTAHYLTTDLEWNPLYICVGRNNKLIHIHKDKIYDKNTNTLQNIEGSTNEYDILLNKETLQELLLE
jgi:hypothetical protein